MTDLILNELKELEKQNTHRRKRARQATVTLESIDKACPQCGEEMKVQYTQPHRRIKTIKYGSRIVRTVTLECRSGCRNQNDKALTRRPEILSQLLPKHSNYSYDVEVFVGLQRYSHHQQREEIQAKLLNDHEIPISTGEISMLTKRFLRHLARLHEYRSPELKAVLHQNGRPPFWIDATGEAGRGTLFLVRGGWNQWVLGAWRLTTECSEQILPCLKQTVETYGPPVSVMRDLGKAIISAVLELADELEVDILILSCHQHFLKDIGKDLLTQAYDELRGLFREYGMSSSLRSLVREWGKKLGPEAKASRDEIEKWTQESACHALPDGATGLALLRTQAQWLLDFEADNENLRFPFDRPHLDFYVRCHKIRRALDAYLRHLPSDTSIGRGIRRLAAITDPVVTDGRFEQSVRILRQRAKLFDELRVAMRLPPKISGRVPSQEALTEKDKAKAIHATKKSLEKFTRSLKKRRPARGPNENTREAIDVILTHIDTHGPTLWGHVIPLLDGNIRVMGRTNIPAEAMFNTLKHEERRRSGRKVLGQDLENLPPSALLVQNLQDPEYVKILCETLDQLPAAFAKLDSLPATESENDEETPTETVETASFSRNDQKFVRKETLGQKNQQGSVKPCAESGGL